MPLLFEQIRFSPNPCSLLCVGTTKENREGVVYIHVETGYHSTQEDGLVTPAKTI